MKAHGELTLPEIATLTRLDRGGPMTGAALAKLEQISPQSMGVTLGALEARDLVERRPDPDDRRQALISITAAGAQVLTNGRNARIEQLAQVLSTGFARAELGQLRAAAPLLERLAQQI